MRERPANPWLVLVVLCGGFFMVLLDLTIVNIAIPSIINGLQAGLDQVLWVLNAYTLTYAVLLVTAGRLGDRFGQRNLFAIGIVVFTAASALCGLARNPDQLIAARAIQAVGGALLTPQTLAILTSIFPPARRGAAFGIWGAIGGIASIAGPTLGGALTTYVSWRWIFYVNVPIGATVLLATFLIVPDLRPGRASRLEPVGVLLASAGLFALNFGLIEGERYQWGTITHLGPVPLTIPAVLVASVVLLALFVLWDRRRLTPLVPLGLFRDRNYAVMSGISAAVSFAMVGLFLPLTIYLQAALGMTAIAAGLTLLPMSVASMPMAPLAGRLADRLGGKYVLMSGLACFGLGMAFVDWRASTDTNWLSLLPGLVLAGIGVGCTFAPMATEAMRNVQPRLAGAASGTYNTIRQVGSTLGAAVVGAVLETELAVTLRREALSHAGQVPVAARQGFVAGFSQAAQGGQLEVGSVSLPKLSGLPPEAATAIAHAAHQVFEAGFIDAMRPTLLVPVAVLLVAAVSCLLAIRYRRTQAQPEPQPEPVETVG
jgi:EmrB/QacA subfamily drug resistance transporter